MKTAGNDNGTASETWNPHSVIIMERLKR